MFSFERLLWSIEKLKANSTVQNHYEVLNNASASVSFAVSLLCSH